MDGLIRQKVDGTFHITHLSLRQGLWQEWSVNDGILGISEEMVLDRKDFFLVSSAPCAVQGVGRGGEAADSGAGLSQIGSRSATF